MESKEINEQIKPFCWVDGEESVSVCLEAGEYKAEIFESRLSEGFEGNGYDWGSLAKVFLDEKKPELVNDINFDPEAGMYCVYSSNKIALKDFSIGFKNACEDSDLILDLFSRAELD